MSSSGSSRSARCSDSWAAPAERPTRRGCGRSSRQPAARCRSCRRSSAFTRSRTPSGTSPKWNTDPPTSGPHYGIPAIFGIYEEELEIARVVHNLEHGGIYILYGKDVPDTTVNELRSFYDDHKTGTIMAPLDRLGDKFALGAWVVDGDTDNGFLAKCTSFDKDAVSTFFRSLQFRGPERFDPSQLQPGM